MIYYFQLREALKFLDDLGTVQYFENEFLRDRVVINPQWIVDIMACLVSVNSPIQVGVNGFPYNQDPTKDIFHKVIFCLSIDTC